MIGQKHLGSKRINIVQNASHGPVDFEIEAVRRIMTLMLFQ